MVKYMNCYTSNIQLLFLIFIVIVWFFISQTTIESFKNRKGRKGKKNKKNKKGRKKTKESFNPESNPVDLLQNQFLDWFKKKGPRGHETDRSQKRDKLLQKMKAKDNKRYELFFNKPSKNTKDSFRKLKSIKNGFTDIMKMLSL